MKTLSITRRKFILINGILAFGLVISPILLAKGQNKPIVRFGMLSDVHYADREPSGTRIYRQSLVKVKEFTDLMNSEKVDFVVELGDFKDQDPVPNELNTLKYLTSIETVFRQFTGPTYHVLGNHDMDGISKEQFLNRVVNTGIPASKSYYSFDRNGFHFVALDGNFTKEGKAYDHGNFSWEDTFIPPSQVKERYSLINNIHYYSLFGVVDGDGPENNSFVIVDIYKDGSLKINGFRRASDREMKK